MFQGIRTNIAKKPYNLWFSGRGDPDPLPPNDLVDRCQRQIITTIFAFQIQIYLMKQTNIYSVNFVFPYIMGFGNLLMFLICWEYCVWLSFVIHYYVSVLVLQLSWRGNDSSLLCVYCLTDVLLLYMLCGSSSRYHWLVYIVLLWYFLIILT